MSDQMTPERLAEIRAAIREPDFKDVYRKYVHPLILVFDATLAELDILRAELDTLRESTPLQCDGCGLARTSAVDADGYHLCRACAKRDVNFSRRVTE